MNTTLQSVIEDRSPVQDPDLFSKLIAEDKCPICNEQIYIQNTWDHEHYEWLKDGFIKSSKITRLEVYNWYTYKYSWDDFTKGHWIYFHDLVFIKDQDPEWIHKLHILNRYNKRVHEVHLIINRHLHEFINNHEHVKDGPFKGLKIDWTNGVTNNEHLARAMNAIYLAWGKPPMKCSTATLGIGKWWKPDWGWIIPQVRRHLYEQNGINLEDVETISKTTNCIEVLNYKPNKKDKPLTPDEEVKRAAWWIKYQFEQSLQKIFKKLPMVLFKAQKGTNQFHDMWLAKKRSEKFLLSHLTHAERVTLKNCGRIDVPSKLHPTQWYSIPVHHKAAIEVHTKEKIIEALCYQLGDRLPIGDEILTKYMACKYDEENMLKIAVVCHRE